MIILRKRAEDLLKANGFGEDFSIARIDKHVFLVGKCGKPIVSVSDLEVPAKLSKQERDIILEEDFQTRVLDKKDKIVELIAKQKEASDKQDTIKEYEEVNRVSRSVYKPYYSDDKVSYTYSAVYNSKIGLENTTVKFRTEDPLAKDFSEDKLIYELPKATEAEIMICIKEAKKLAKKLIPYIELNKEYQELFKEEEDIKKELKIICKG